MSLQLLETGIVALINDNVADINGRCYPYMGQQTSAKFPYILYSLDSVEPTQGFGGHLDLSRANFTVESFGSNYANAKKIAQDVRAILNGYSGSPFIGATGVAATGATIEINSNFHIAEGDTLTLQDAKGNPIVLTVGDGVGEIDKPSGGTSGGNNALFAGRIGAVISNLDSTPFATASMDETDQFDYEIVLSQNAAGIDGNTTPVIVAENGTAGWEVTAGFTGGTDSGVTIKSSVHDNDSGNVSDSQTAGDRGVSSIESEYIIWFSS